MHRFQIKEKVKTSRCREVKELDMDREKWIARNEGGYTRACQEPYYVEPIDDDLGTNLA